MCVAYLKLDLWHGTCVTVVSALPYWLTGFKRHRQRIGNNTAKTMLPQEDGTEIFWNVTKITEAEITEILDRRSGLRMGPGNGRTRCVLTLAYVSLRLLT